MNSAMENLKGIIAKNNEIAKKSTKEPIGEECRLNDTKKKRRYKKRRFSFVMTVVFYVRY